MKKLLTALLVIVSLASCHKTKYTSGWEAYPQPAGERPKVVYSDATVEWALPDTTIEYKRPHSTYINQ